MNTITPVTTPEGQHVTVWTEPAPLCDLCHTAQQKQQRLDRALEVMRQPMIVDGEEWVSTVPPTELTPAGLNYLLPGLQPIHETEQVAQQPRLI